MRTTQEQIQNTLAYYNKLKSHPAVRAMSWDELLRELDRLGYRVCKATSFFYYNTSNYPDLWLAYACYIVDKASGLSFVNIESRRDGNFEALQQLRREAVVMYKDKYLVQL